jgi:hypothetical protein
LRGEGVSAKAAKQTHCIKGHLLSKENAPRVGKTLRSCLECHRARVRKTRAKRKDIYRLRRKPEARCPQCGLTYRARPCGPSHATRWRAS